MEMVASIDFGIEINMGLVRFLASLSDNIVDIISRSFFRHSGHLYGVMTNTYSRIGNLRTTMLDNDLMFMRILVTQNLREVKYATYEGIDILYTTEVSSKYARLTRIAYDDENQPNPARNQRVRMLTIILERCVDYVANATILNQMLCQLQLMSPDDSTEGRTLQEHSSYVKRIQNLFYTENTITTDIFKRTFLAFPIPPTDKHKA